MNLKTGDLEVDLQGQIGFKLQKLVTLTLKIKLAFSLAKCLKM